MKQLFLCIILIFTTLVFACTNDPIITNSSEELTFSIDTVLFDTVFTTIGSTTQQLRVKNPNRYPITIKSIELAGGDKSNYRLNIDGIPTNQMQDYKLQAKDSMFIFIEVTVDPTLQNAPLLIHDSIVFKTNGNIQDVDLVAYGQDMHVLRNEVIETSTWVNDKPYLIYDTVLIDNGNTLTIEAGTQIHFNKDAVMFIFGNLQVKGTKEDSVVFQGIRLEEMYRDIPGQWRGLIFIEGSRNNSFDYAVIKNAVIGMNVGTLDVKNQNRPLVRLNNTKIEHITYAGIYALQAEIFATNCLIDNCGVYSMALVIGGDYRFYHCTFIDYWHHKVRSEPSVVLTNNLYVDRLNQVTGLTEKFYYVGDLTQAYFGNCIIYGDKFNELGLGEDKQVVFNYYFDHCALKVDTSVHTSNKLFFEKPLVNPYLKFVNSLKHDYRLDTLSPAKDYGKYDIINQLPGYLEKDLKGDWRDSKPDLGAYERIEKK